MSDEQKKPENQSLGLQIRRFNVHISVTSDEKMIWSQSLSEDFTRHTRDHLPFSITSSLPASLTGPQLLELLDIFNHTTQYLWRRILTDSLRREKSGAGPTS